MFYYLLSGHLIFLSGSGNYSLTCVHIALTSRKDRWMCVHSLLVCAFIYMSLRLRHLRPGGDKPWMSDVSHNKNYIKRSNIYNEEFPFQWYINCSAITVHHMIPTISLKLFSLHGWCLMLTFGFWCSWPVFCFFVFIILIQDLIGKKLPFHL